MNFQKIRDVIVDWASMIGPWFLMIMGVVALIDYFGWFTGIASTAFIAYCVVMDIIENYREVQIVVYRDDEE